MSNYSYVSGDEIEIRINTGDLSVEKWEPGTFQSYIPCNGPGCRVNVTMDNGINLKGIKPECIRKKKK